MSSSGTLENKKGADVVQWIKEEVLEWDFSASVLLTLRSEQFFAVLCSVGWLGGIPGLSPLDPGNPPGVATKSISKHYTSTGGKITPTENQCFGVRLLAGCVTFNELRTFSGPPLCYLYSESMTSTWHPRAVEKFKGGVHPMELGAWCGPGPCQVLAGEQRPQLSFSPHLPYSAAESTVSVLVLVRELCL